jgi:hypothetical protein
VLQSVSDAFLKLNSSGIDCNDPEAIDGTFGNICNCQNAPEVGTDHNDHDTIGDYPPGCSLELQECVRRQRQDGETERFALIDLCLDDSCNT